MRELYTSEGKKIEFTPEGCRIFEIEDYVIDEEKTKTVQLPCGGAETTYVWKKVINKVYWGPWISCNKYDGPRQSHMTEFLCGQD